MLMSTMICGLFTLSAGYNFPAAPRATEPLARRAFISGAAALAVLGGGRAARADYGDAASMALPALLPSPIRPTGRMAETCEVVALGREDVCLEPKKLMSAYDQLQLERITEALEEQIGYGAARAPLLPSLRAIKGLIGLVTANRFDDVTAALAQPPLAELTTTVTSLAGSDSTQQKRAAAIKAALKTLGTESKERRAGPSAQALTKIGKEICAFADN